MRLLLLLDPLLVLIEYVPYGDLLGYLRKSRGLNDTYYKDPDVKPQTNLTADQLLKFAWQIADGMNYLSSIKVYPFSYETERIERENLERASQAQGRKNMYLHYFIKFELVFFFASVFIFIFNLAPFNDLLLPVYLMTSRFHISR